MDSVQSLLSQERSLADKSHESHDLSLESKEHTALDFSSVSSEEGSEEFNSEGSQASQLESRLQIIEEELEMKTRAMVENFQATLLEDPGIQNILENFEDLFVEDSESQNEIVDQKLDLIEVSENVVLTAVKSEALKVEMSVNVSNCDKPNCENQESKQQLSSASCDNQQELNQQLSKLSTSTQQQAGQVRQANDDLGRLKTQLRDFKGVIKAKEGLIKDLKKAGKDSEEVRFRLESKLEKLERESRRTQRELMAAQSMLRKLEAGNSSNKPGSGTEEEYKNKVEKYKKQVDELRQRVMDTEQLLEVTKPEANKILKLQESIHQLKEEHERLKLRYNDEQQRKYNLETTLEQDKVVIEQLQPRLQTAQQVLKESLEKSGNFDRKQQWLELEEKRLKQVHNQTMAFHNQLMEKEKLLNSQEIKETSFINQQNLEIKAIKESKKSLEVQQEKETVLSSEDIRHKIHELRGIRDTFVRERQELDAKLEVEKLLSPAEEGTMLELDESIEALDAAIEYKNDTLLGRNVDYNTVCGNLLLDRLVGLGPGEVKSLLHKYFLRVLDLRLEGRKLEVHVEEVEEQYNDLGRYVRDLAHSLQRSKLDAERRLVAQQREYQTKMNLLVQQLGEGARDTDTRETTRKIRSLEKDLHHYKKLCRTLRSDHQGDNETEIAKANETLRDEPNEYISENESVVSHVQPSHIQQFQRRLARLQRKMDSTPKPTVTREHRKLIIENPPSQQNSLDRTKAKTKKKR